jgi:hypothetical protein
LTLSSSAKMPIVINATPASPDANSFISLAEANAYFAENPNGYFWENTGTEEEKKSALIWATRLLNTFSYFGYKFRNSQALKLPTVGYSNQQSARIVTLTSQTVFTVNNILDRNMYGEDYWLYAGLEMRSGDTKYQHRMVTGYNIATGQLTIESAFDGTIAVGNQLVLTQEVPRPVKWATCELAYVYVLGQDPMSFDPRVSSYRVGDVSETFGKKSDGSFVLPPRVMSLLNGYITVFEHGTY